jgi:lipoic acid synthetase
MILGNLCTRGCGFCSVPKSRHPGALDPDEPPNIARMAAAMRLRYVIITSVNRDDLPVGGSAHFARTVWEVRQSLPWLHIGTIIFGR